MTKTTEENIEELRIIRNMLKPSYIEGDDNERKKALDDLKNIRRIISPVCSITYEERNKNLEEIRYISSLRGKTLIKKNS